jgi:Flp pilus assembly CpaF family ATPase
VAANGQYLDPDAPFANLTLACGARLHAALVPVANEAQVSIRLHFGMGTIRLAHFGPPESIEVIRQAVSTRRTIIIGGATSSGKSMNAILNDRPR